MKYFTSGEVMNKARTLLLILLFQLTIQDAIAQHYLKSSVFSNGAVHLSNESYSLNATVGQPVIGIISGNTYRNHIGFWYNDNQFMTSIGDGFKQAPENFELLQNYPNPFNTVTHIRYVLPEPAYVQLEVFNLLGQSISTLVNSKMPAGIHETRFSAMKLPAGYYIYSIHANEFQEIKRMIIIK